MLYCFFLRYCNIKNEAIEILKKEWDDNELTENYDLSSYADCFHLSRYNYSGDIQLKEGDIIYSKHGSFKLNPA